MSFVFKNTGYATLQRNLCYEFRSKRYMFEVQIRTALEHAWSEPEHSMVYKGDFLSEHVKGLFRNFGLNLSAADDLLQIVMDEWRRETDQRADYSDRALRTFRVDEKRLSVSQNGVINKDLAHLYDCLKYGYVNDAIAIAEALAKKVEIGSSEYIQFRLEEAVCRMCNQPFFFDDSKIEEYLNLGIALPDNDPLKFWAYFRKAHYYYLKAESIYVEQLRHGWDNSTSKLLPACKEAIDACLSMTKHAHQLYNNLPIPLNHLPQTTILPVEILILEGRCFQWYARIAKQEKESAEQIIAKRQKCVRSSMDAIEMLRQIGDAEVFTHNNADLGAYNSKLWYLRLLFDDMVTQNFDAEQIQEVLSDATTTYAALLDHCTNPDILNKVSDPSDRQVRQRLAVLMEIILTQDEHEEFNDVLLACSIFELKVLDTIVGLRLIKIRHPRTGPDLAAKQFNDALRDRLVRIAAKGDLSFDSYFAFSLLMKRRIAF